MTAIFQKQSNFTILFKPTSFNSKSENLKKKTMYLIEIASKAFKLKFFKKKVNCGKIPLN